MEQGINWQTWNSETFRLADMERRPILLSISAVWCHWCHVMDETTYSDEDVVGLINASFVPIRVDTDKRPDINRRYNMGGWPTTAFLNPNGEILTGSTYIPPEPMKKLLRKITGLYRETKGILNPTVPSLIPRFAAPSSQAAKKGLSSEVAQAVSAILERNFDAEHGGFGQAPKFPMTSAITFLLAQGLLTGDRALKDHALQTLEKMASGDIFDRISGGFFRYATERDWGSPHYEKMLEDNARLLSVYLEAYQITGDERFQMVAEKTAAYIDSTLRAGSEGGFFGSQDADESYYRLSAEERAAASPPKVDGTIYSGWNALAASAYLKAAAVLSRGEWKEYALKTLALLQQHCLDARLGLKHFYAEGKAELPGILSDQVQFGLALVDAYESTGDTKYLQTAEKVVELMAKNLSDTHGGFFDLPEDPEAQGHLRERDKPIHENSLAALLLLRLHRLTDTKHYLEQAASALTVFGSNYKEYGPEAAAYAYTILVYASSPVKIVLVGTEDKIKELSDASLKIYDPRKTIAAAEGYGEVSELAGLPETLPEPPVAYICVGNQCLAPAATAEALTDRFEDFRRDEARKET